MYDKAKHIILYGYLSSEGKGKGPPTSCCPHLFFGAHLCKLRGIAKVKTGWPIFIQ